MRCLICYIRVLWLVNLTDTTLGESTNFKQALKIRFVHRLQLEQFEASTSFTEANFIRSHQKENIVLSQAGKSTRK
jgi:hypothetical protein